MKTPEADTDPASVGAVLQPAMRRDALRRDARYDDHAARSVRRKKGEAGAWLVSMTTNHYRRLCHQLLRAPTPATPTPCRFSNPSS